MDFAKRQLLKYGWTEGKGLGKNENGISQPLKSTLKFDTAGIGHNIGEELTNNWWENVYNQAANNIKVEHSDDGSVNVRTNSNESVDITTKKYSYKHSKKNLEYGSFLKTSALAAGFTTDVEDKPEIIYAQPQTILNDEELFAACGGRTAHKGARHGLKLNGKLTRIQEQEEKLLKKMKKRAKALEPEQSSASKDTENKHNLQDNQQVAQTEKTKKKKPKKKKEPDEAENKTEDHSKKKKKTKKRTYSATEIDDFVEVDATNKRLEYYCAKQKRKKLKILQRREDKRMSAMSDFFESACVLNPEKSDNKDDGFVENSCTKSVVIDGEEVKHRKKKRKKKKVQATAEKGSEDDGFEECINEVNEKLIQYKELRKDLESQQKKGSDKKVAEMAEMFKNSL